MKSIATWFFATAAIFALCGMAWGIQMAATNNHLMAPAHGHLNLIGFVAMSVFGAYYALTPAAAASALAKIHYALSVAAVLVITPGIALAVSAQGEELAKIGSVITILSMALYAFIVIRHGVGRTVSDASPVAA